MEIQGAGVCVSFKSGTDGMLHVSPVANNGKMEKCYRDHLLHIGEKTISKMQKSD